MVVPRQCVGVSKQAGYKIVKYKMLFFSVNV
jgi:hypothetical protein